MILYVRGNLFDSPAQVLVNTVNTVGVMGRGIAQDFKRLFPDMFKEYQRLCEDAELQIGTLHLFKSANKWVLNFPTKKHWRQPSQPEYIERGLSKFAATYHQMGITSIAFPPLGCGNGQLDFESQVQPLMHFYLRNLPIDVFIYPARSVDFVEHRQPEEMRNWLREEPASLPFSEVWEDITQLLERTESFTTLSKGSDFTATVAQDGKGISITAAQKRFRVEYDVLKGIWQQLKSYGFSTRSIVPGINKDAYYVLPLFAELDYVQQVRVSEDYHRLDHTTAVGLQLLPSAFKRGVHPDPLQPALFQLLEV